MILSGRQDDFFFFLRPCYGFKYSEGMIYFSNLNTIGLYLITQF